MNSEEIEGIEDTEDNREHSNLYGKNFLMWFEIGIEGKSPIWTKKRMTGEEK